MIKTAEEESTPRSIPSPERRSRRKFILIDHSIKGFGGHHYEYAVHVLNAAQELGFEPILAVNRAFSRDPDETAPWTTIPVYEFGFWPEPESDESSGLKALKGLAFDLRIRLVYGRIGLFRARLVSLHTSLSTEEAIHRTEQVHLTGGLLIARFLITYPHLVLKSLWQLIRAIFAFIPPGFFRYFRNIGSAFINVIRQAVYPFKVFKLIRGHSHRSRLSVRLKAFERDTRLLFNSRSPVEEGDLPGSLLERFSGEDQRRLEAVLRWLAPSATATT
ncbi:MAG: hypothetical protein ACE5EQ_09845 [Phycisphaerae bacterium]